MPLPFQSRERAEIDYSEPRGQTPLRQEDNAMILNQMAITQTRARLITTPGWEKMNASERTLVCCRELTRCGFTIPGWNTLREIIEKGSGTDISKAKATYQLELAEQVTTAEAESVALDLDLPASISGLFEDLWRKAVHESGLAFAARKVEIQREAEQLRLEMEQERTIAQQAVEQSNKLSVELQFLKQQLQDSQRQCTILRAEKEQTEKLVSEAHLAVRYQTERADQTTKNAQAQIAEALARLEGVENHSLREIDRARHEAKSLIEEGAENSRRTVDALTKRLNEIKEKNSLLTQQSVESRLNADFYRARYEELQNSKAEHQQSNEIDNIKTRLKDIRSNRDMRVQRVTQSSSHQPLVSSTKKKR